MTVFIVSNIDYAAGVRSTWELFYQLAGIAAHGSLEVPIPRSQVLTRRWPAMGGKLAGNPSVSSLRICWVVTVASWPGRR